MSKLNTPGTVPAGRSPVKAVSGSSVTHEGGIAFDRETKSELFLLGVNYFFGEQTFYESASQREVRWEKLITAVAREDPKWMLGFLNWLRGTGNIRTASITGAAIAVRARLTDNMQGTEGWNRKFIRAVCQRADEPGEFLAYWVSKYGKPLPMPVKRGLSDACARLYNEYSLLKYDTASHGWRFADVLNMVHAAPAGENQAAVYSFSQARRFNNVWEGSGHQLPMISANEGLRLKAVNHPEALLDAENLKAAGMTWEDALSLAGSRVPKDDLWEAMIPSMGYMAALRNLRNFDEAGISDASVEAVCEKLSNPEIVAKSRQFPFRFVSAYKELNSLNYGKALEKALDYSTQNIPELPGITYIYVDTSGSMQSRVSDKSKLACHEAAGLFGVALARKNQGRVRLFGYADGVFEHVIPTGSSVLKAVADFYRRNGEVGYGTQTVASVRRTLGADAKRVVIFTDGQAFFDWHGSVDNVVPKNTYLYGFNLGGYSKSMMPSGVGTRHELGGLSDATFSMIPLIERGREARWPWED